MIPAVVSIGNITVGGTGKTPLVQLLAAALVPHYKVAVLSRGYRSCAENSDTPLILNEKTVDLHSRPQSCGDEPYMLWKNVPGATVYVGKNRQASARQAAIDGMQVAILDDGMQHRKLARDFDLVILDGKDPFGQRHILPRGLLREEIGALRRADLIVVNHADDKKTYRMICEEIRAYSDAPTIAAHVSVKAVRTLKGLQIDSLKGKKIAFFCGLGNPARFEETLESLGAVVIDRLYLPDHGGIDENRLAQFSEQARLKGAELILCSEKDRVKLNDDIRTSLPIAWTQIALEFTEGSEHWDELLENINRKIRGFL